MLEKQDLLEALETVRSVFPETPMIFSHDLSACLGRPIYLKLENLQVTGSFKVRGAMNCIANLGSEQRSRGVITCSSGNHGRAVATVSKMLGVAATICVPSWIDPLKLNAMKSTGAEIIVEGETYDEAEQISRELGEQKNLVYVHPFDDLMVIAGQGTVALEILSQLPQVGDILVPLSGGGLAGGIGWTFREFSSGTNVIAVSAKQASVMLASVRKGLPIKMDEENTVASALSGGIDLGNKHTFNLINETIDQHLVVDEEMILNAMSYALKELHLVVEGGGAVGLAALLGEMLSDKESTLPLVVVVSGGNVATKELLTRLNTL